MSYLNASWAVLTLLANENGGPIWTAAVICLNLPDSSRQVDIMGRLSDIICPQTRKPSRFATPVVAGGP